MPKKCRPIQECFHNSRRWRVGDGKVLTVPDGEEIPPYFVEMGVSVEEDTDAGYENNSVLNASIREALEKLDGNNNDHWTAKGLPMMTVVEALLGFEVLRTQVDEAWPGFNREVMTLKAVDKSTDLLG